MARRLFIVDDMPEIGNLLRLIAEDIGYDVRVVTNAHDFMEQFDAFCASHVMLDIVMPNMDGIELLRWLADRKAKCKIILMSGFNPHYVKSGETLAEVHNLDILGTLTKPISAETVRAILT